MFHSDGLRYFVHPGADVGLTPMVEVYNVLNPPQASPVVSRWGTCGNGSAATLAGNLAFASDSSGVLWVIDTSDPLGLVELSSLDVDAGVGPIAIQDDHAFVPVDKDSGGGMCVVDISDPVAPVVVGYYDTEPDTWCIGVGVEGDVAYIVATSGEEYWDDGYDLHFYEYVWLETVDVSDKTTPVRLDRGGDRDCYRFKWVYQIVPHSGIVYVATEHTSSEYDHLLIFDATDPTDVRGRTPRANGATAVTIAGANAYITSIPDAEHRPGGLGYYDIPATHLPARLSLLEMHSAAGIHLAGPTAYVGDTGLTIVNVADPYAPRRIASYRNGVEYRRILVEEPYALLSSAFWSSGCGIDVLDLSDCPGCDADLTTMNASPGEFRYGLPDFIVSGADLQYFVNAWVSGDAEIADLTSQNAPAGSPGYMVPDGLVTGADIQMYVNLWLAGSDGGCP